MKFPLKILYLEDNPNDAKLVKKELQSANLPCQIDRVDTEKNFLSAISENEYDLIFGDHSLPSFDGSSALKHAREKCPHIPFIFVSGTLGEETAIETLKNGATDYVLKNRLSRLGPAVKRALKEREKQDELLKAERDLRENEIKYRLLFESANDAIFLMKEDRLIDCNEKTTKFFGCAREQIIGESPYRFSPEAQPDGRNSKEKALEKIKAALKGDAQFFEWTHCRYDGTPFDSEISLNRIRLQGRFYLQAVGRDVSKRKQTEKQLKEGTKFAISTINSLSSEIAILNKKGVILQVNSAWRRFGKENGLTKELVGENYLAACHTASAEDAPEAAPVAKGIRDVISGKRTEFSIEYPCHTNRKKRWFVLRVTPFEGSGPASVVVSHYNITQRKLAEEALRQSEGRYRNIIDFAPLGIYQSTREGRFITANWFLAKMLGYGSPEELMKRNLSKDIYFDEKQREKFIRKYEPAGSAGNIELLWKKKDGSPVWIELTSHAIKDSSGKTLYFEGFVMDRSERKKAEEELKNSEERLKILFEYAPDAYYLMDLMGNFVDGNKAAEQLIGYSRQELTGENIAVLGIVPEEQIPKVLESLEHSKKGLPYGPNEFTLISKEKKRLEVEVRSFPVNIKNNTLVLGIARDVTDRKNLEEQFRQAQKMEAIGRLAGGVAHDFNNLLTVIRGYSDLLLNREEIKEKLGKELSLIKDAAERASSLTSQLLAFSRKQKTQFTNVNLNSLVKDLQKMLQRLIGEDVELQAKLPETKFWLKADPGQISQIIMNLSINARDAMPEGGKLTIETRRVTIDEEYARKHIDSEPGDYIQLSLTDTGTGMDKETLSHIFEPFFTTKPEGKGTGLGLATVYGIVRQHGGFIWVYSEPGYGTTFKLYFPVVGDADDMKGKEKEVDALPEGSETILIVEDDELVRKLAHKILSLSGYAVQEVASAGEAIGICQNRKAPIQLLLTDVILPKMSGKTLAEKLLALFPEMKVIYMSGYTDDVIAHHGVLEEGIEFLEKPFSTMKLVQKVREVLDKKAKGKSASPRK